MREQMPERKDDDSAIGKQVLLAWSEHKAPFQIAEELELELKSVMQILKREQKKLIEGGGPGHGEGG